MGSLVLQRSQSSERPTDPDFTYSGEVFAVLVLEDRSVFLAISMDQCGLLLYDSHSQYEDGDPATESLPFSGLFGVKACTPSLFADSQILLHLEPGHWHAEVLHQQTGQH